MPITITGNSGISMPDEGIEAKDLGNGAIIQVIFASKTDVGGAFSTLAWSDTGLEATITPTTNSNKILIQAKPCLSWDKAVTKMTAAIFKGSESDPLLRADAAGDRLR